MSDEEKKAIESLKNIAIYIGDNYTFSQQGIRNLRENLRIVLSVIEKQSKEIERINEILIWKQKHEEQLQKEIEELKDKYSDEKIRNTIIKRYREVIEKDYVSKDLIREKIEDLKKQDKEDRLSHNYLIIPVLQSLLKEE